MEKEQAFKQKLIKSIFVFLGIILICTLLSRSIYEYLLPVVTATKVKSGSVEVKYIATGKIGLDEDALKSKQAVLMPTMDGQIVEVLKEEGESVKKGEAICQIQKGDYATSVQNKALEETQLTLEQEGIDREIASKMEEKKRLITNYEAKTEELANAETSAKILDLQEAIKTQITLVEATTELYKEGLVAASSYEEEKNKLASLERNLKIEKETLEATLRTELDNLQKQLDEVDISLANLKDQKYISQKKQEIVGSNALGETLTSPMEGYIYTLNIAKGAYVGKNDKLVVIVPHEVTSHLSFEVTEEVAGKLQMGQTVNFGFNQRQYKASMIKKKFNEESGQYVVSAEVEQDLLKQMNIEGKGYRIVNVEIVNSSNEYPMIVDRTTIKTVYANHFVFVIEESEGIGRTVYKIREVPVTVLEEGDYKSAISGQFDSKQLLVSSQLGNLEDGQEVTLK